MLSNRHFGKPTNKVLNPNAGKDKKTVQVSAVMAGGKEILVVSHKATIRLLLSSLLGFDPRRYRDSLDQKPAALNIVDFRDPTCSRLILFNDTSHYKAGGLAIPATPTSRLSKYWNVAAGAKD